jgi:hypothetical protein
MQSSLLSNSLSQLLNILSQLKTLIEIIQGLLTCIALVSGGVWTYYTFIYKREKVPRAVVESSIESYLISDAIYLSVSLVIRNVGSTLISFKEINVRIQQIIPKCDGYEPIYYPNSSSAEFGWPTIATNEQKFAKRTLEIEPSETHQFLFEFLFPTTNLELIKIYSHLQYYRSDLGWSIKKLHSFDNLHSV